MNVTASSPTEFFLVEALRVAVPVCGIALVLIAATRRRRAASTKASRWLVIITGLWLSIAFANRTLMCAPVRNYFISAAMERAVTSHRESLYFTATEWLWTAEQIVILLFGLALFFALHREPRGYVEAKTYATK